MKKTSILVMTIVTLALVGFITSCNKDDNNNPNLRSKTYNLTEANGSGLSGTVTFKEATGNKTDIVVIVDGLAPSTSYLNHIHTGSISSPGAIYIPLTDVQSSTSMDTVTTNVNFVYDSLINYNGYYNLHNPADISQSFLQGNIGSNAP